MRRTLWLVLLGLGSLACTTDNRTTAADDKKGTVVELDGLKSTAPADWKEEEVSSNLRFMQFKLPKVKEDKNDAEVVIFKLGGTAKDNVQRWKDQFTPPEGKKIDDVAKVTEMKVGDVPVTYLDVSGTYKFKTRPNDPNDKGEARPNYRMVGVIFEGPKGQYQIRFVGPADTVENYKKGFDEWLKNFK
jgi:hypothetical protein